MPMILLILFLLTGATYDKVPDIIIHGDDCPPNTSLRLFSRDDCPSRQAALDRERAGRSYRNLSALCIEQMQAGLDAYCEGKAVDLPLTDWIE